MRSRKLFRSSLREKKYQIFFYLVRQVLEKQQLLKHCVMRLVAITLSSMALMSLALMSFVIKLKTMLLQFLWLVAEKLSSLMRLIISILIQLNLLYGEPLKNLPRTVPSFLPVILKTGSSIQSTLGALSSTLKSTVLNQSWLHNSLKELKIFLNKKVSNIQKMLLRQSLQSIFQTIEEFLMNCSDIRYLAPLILVSFLILVIYNLNL